MAQADVSLLSAGAIKACMEGQAPPIPRLQILGIKGFAGDSRGNQKFRVQVSDGIHCGAGMLASQLNEKVNSEEISKYCIVQVDKMVLNSINAKKIMIFIKLRVLYSAKDVGGMLGNPRQLQLDDNSVPIVKEEHTEPRQPQPPPLPRAPPPQQQIRPPLAQMRAPPPQQVQTPPRSAFYGNTVPQRVGGGMGGAMGGASSVHQSPGGNRNVVPITALNPYQNKWTIKVRVTSKPPLRHYNNARGEGRILTLEFVDHSGEIRATAFNEDADRFYPNVDVNKVYYVSKGRIKPANKQFYANNDYELTLGNETTIEECFDDVSDLPSTALFNFVAIGDLEIKPKDSIVDVIGVCVSAGDVGSVTVRASNRKVSKRDITLLDKSGRSVICTLWGTTAEEFDSASFPVVAMKSVKVSDFNGVSLTALSSSSIHCNPDLSDAHQLKGWYDHYGKDQDVTSLSLRTGGGNYSDSTFLTFRQIKELNQLGQQEKPDYFSCKGMIVFLKKDTCLYKACPSQDCNKKVNDDGTGNYFCEKCGRGYDKFKYRLIMRMNCVDYLDDCWLDTFSEGGAAILGMDGQALGELKEQDAAQFDLVVQEAYFKEFIFRVRAKVDTYNDEQRLRCSCVSVQPLNYASETKRLVTQIKEMMAK